MKKIFLICAACMFLLCSCCISQEETTDSTATMFVVVEKNPDWTVVYHKESKVMYAVSAGYENRGIFTLLVNKDGSPMLYEEVSSDG